MFGFENEDYTPSPSLKHFRVICTASGYGWSKVEWEKYFSCRSRETLESVLRDRYGNFDKYFRYDEAEEHITMEEIEVEPL